MATARGVPLLSRSFLVTGMAVFLAAAAHAAGGGGMPPVMLLLALAVILLPPVVLLARRQLSFPVLACVLAAGQLLLHTAFSLVPAASGCAAAGPAVHAHHAAAAPGRRPAGHAGEQLAEAAGNGWQMSAAHLAAVVLTAVLLARGEDALWQLLTWLRPLARIPAPATLPAPAPTLFTVREADALPTGTDRCVHRLRGPPALPCS